MGSVYWGVHVAPAFVVLEIVLPTAAYPVCTDEKNKALIEPEPGLGAGFHVAPPSVVFKKTPVMLPPPTNAVFASTVYTA